jgi:AmmeMemoRadiSam system protein A
MSRVTHLPLERGRELARYARSVIASALGGPAAFPPSDPDLKGDGACFVTLRRPDGRLHGCIGSVEARRPLFVDVADNTIAAALYDPRATRLPLVAVPSLSVELSLLTPLERVLGATEEEIVSMLRTAVDGVVFRGGGRTATFLPQMWARFEDGWELLAELKEKAGLEAGFWHEDVEVFRFQVEAFEELGIAREAQLS